jgi:hypothetical protein
LFQADMLEFEFGCLSGGVEGKGETAYIYGEETSGYIYKETSECVKHIHRRRVKVAETEGVLRRKN